MPQILHALSMVRPILMRGHQTSSWTFAVTLANNQLIHKKKLITEHIRNKNLDLHGFFVQSVGRDRVAMTEGYFFLYFIYWNTATAEDCLYRSWHGPLSLTQKHSFSGRKSVLYSFWKKKADLVFLLQTQHLWSRQQALTLIEKNHYRSVVLRVASLELRSIIVNYDSTS